MSQFNKFVTKRSWLTRFEVPLQTFIDSTDDPCLNHFLNLDLNKDDSLDISINEPGVAHNKIYQEPSPDKSAARKIQLYES